MKVIDIHIHGAFGISFDNARAQDINEFARIALQKGIVAFCPTLTGGSTEEIKSRLSAIYEAKKRQKKDEALIIGANLEGTFLSGEKPGVQNPDNFMPPTVENFKKITQEYEEAVKIVVLAPEAASDDKFINYLKSKDIKVHFGHTKTRTIKGADCINHLFNAMEPMTHKHETLAVKSLLDFNIYTELIADTKHVTSDVIKLTFMCRPTDKIILISDALPVADSNLPFVDFCGKKVLNTGYDENGILGGSVTLLPDIAENLVKKQILPYEKVQKAAFDNPKNYLKLIV